MDSDDKFIMCVIGKLMTRDVVCADMDITLGDAMELCSEKHIRHLPILDEYKQLAGMITDRDLRYHLSPRIGTLAENKSDRESLEHPVHLIMRRQVVVASADTTLSEAAQLMLANRVGCLPILNLGRHVVGIFSTTDLLKYIAQRGV
jgi:CBS domain-containing protein